MTRYVTIAKFAAVSGYTEKAIRRKIEEGVWLEGRQYIVTPDGDEMVDTQTVTKRDLSRKLSRRLASIKALQIHGECGVYLLLSAGEVVYVGRSTALRSRVATHKVSGREFDEVRVIPCDEPTSIWLEKELIRTLKPAQNLLRYARHAEAADVALESLT